MVRIALYIEVVTDRQMLEHPARRGESGFCSDLDSRTIWLHGYAQ